MAQHLTVTVNGQRGISSAGFSEEHLSTFDILERPEARNAVSGDVADGEAIAWVLTLEVPDWSPHTLSLEVSGATDGWHVSLGEELATVDPETDSMRSADVLLTIRPRGDFLGAETITVTARSGENEVGRVTATVRHGP
jgi:hypothetical protein